MVRGVAETYALAEEINRRIGRPQIDTIDIGGGLPVNFASEVTAPTYTEYARVLREAVPGLFDGRYGLVTEFGRSLLAKHGTVVARVEYAKSAGGRPVAVTHAGVQVATRTVYAPGAWPLRIAGVRRQGEAEGAGPRWCRTWRGRPVSRATCWRRGRALPLLDQGDYAAALDTGAYYFAHHYRIQLAGPRPAVGSASPRATVSRSGRRRPREWPTEGRTRAARLGPGAALAGSRCRTLTASCPLCHLEHVPRRRSFPRLARAALCTARRHVRGGTHRPADPARPRLPSASARRDGRGRRAGAWLGELVDAAAAHPPELADSTARTTAPSRPGPSVRPGAGPPTSVTRSGPPSAPAVARTAVLREPSWPTPKPRVICALATVEGAPGVALVDSPPVWRSAPWAAARARAQAGTPPQPGARQAPGAPGQVRRPDAPGGRRRRLPARTPHAAGTRGEPVAAAPPRAAPGRRS